MIPSTKVAMQDRDDGDIEDARSAHKGSHKPASNTTLSSHAPPKHPVSSQMETASMRSYSNHGHESSVQMAATSGAGWTKSIQSSGSGGGSLSLNNPSLATCASRVTITRFNVHRLSDLAGSM